MTFLGKNLLVKQFLLKSLKKQKKQIEFLEDSTKKEIKGLKNRIEAEMNKYPEIYGPNPQDQSPNEE